MYRVLEAFSLNATLIFTFNTGNNMLLRLQLMYVCMINVVLQLRMYVD